VAKRQLALYSRLRSKGAIRHNYLFFAASGDPIESLLYTGDRWRSTLRRLPVRYRRPYCARHTSVSWNLIAGKNPLYVSRQHGHSVETMWHTYSAWMDGALESDVALIKESMERTSSTGTETSAADNTTRAKKVSLSGLLHAAVSRLPRFLGLARICQSICQYANALVS
jgi:hypothetical protein